MVVLGMVVLGMVGVSALSQPNSNCTAAIIIDMLKFFTKEHRVEFLRGTL
jgi:hypothetical protein